MTNGPQSPSHVAAVQQRIDDTIEVHVLTDSFNPGQEVEVSVYLTQGNTWVTFNDKKHIPSPDPNDPKQTVLHVGLPVTPLNPDEDLAVVTRVAEVWPTYLEQNSQIAPLDIPEGLKAVWTPKDWSGKGLGDTASPQTGN